MRRIIQARKIPKFGAVGTTPPTPTLTPTPQPAIPILELHQDMLSELKMIVKLLEDQYGSTIYISKENAAVQMLIGTTPVLIYHATYPTVVILANNTQLTVATDNRIYIGNSAVSATAGFPIFESTTLSFILPIGVELWGVSKTNQQDLRYMVM